MTRSDANVIAKAINDHGEMTLQAAELLDGRLEIMGDNIAHALETIGEQFENLVDAIRDLKPDDSEYIKRRAEGSN